MCVSYMASVNAADQLLRGLDFLLLHIPHFQIHKLVNKTLVCCKEHKEVSEIRYLI